MKKGFFILFIALLVVSCRDTLPKNQTTATPAITKVFPPSPLPVQPITETETPVHLLPSPLVFHEFKGMSFREGAPVAFINATGSMPTVSGTYIIYANYGKSLKYASLDGKIQGDLFHFSERFPLYISYEDEYSRSLHFLAGESPKLIRSYQSGVPDIFIKGEYNIMETDLVGNLMKSWKLLPTDWCFAPFFSDQGNFVIVECEETGTQQHYLNIINLEQENKKKAYQLPSCRGEPVRPGIIWASDNEHFLYSCPSSSPEKNLHCFISVSDDDIICKQIHIDSVSEELKILSISPDWSKVILDLGFQPVNKNGKTSGFRIFITELECILYKEFCNQGITVNLPLEYAFDPNINKNSITPRLHLYWNVAKNELIWMTSSYDGSNNRSLNSHLVGRFNLLTGQNQIVKPGENHINKNRWYENTEIIGVSPDGDWLLYYALEPTTDYEKSVGYYAMSLENGSIHSVALATNMSGDIVFYGWLTIP